MTGRTNSNKGLEKTRSSSALTEIKKPVKSKTNQSGSYEALSRDFDKKPLSQSIGLKEAIDSARRSFEKGFKGQSSSRKRVHSGSNNLSSRVSTRSRSGNISPIDQQILGDKSLSPSDKSPKKSSSAPASPTKPCKQDISQPKHSLPKRMKLDQSKTHTNTRISRSQLLLQSAENTTENNGISKTGASMNSISVDSEIIVNLPTSPKLRERKESSKSSNSPRYNFGSTSFAKDQSLPLSQTEKEISLCSVLDSTLDASFNSNNLSANEDSNKNSENIENQLRNVSKSPNRMLLSDSKRGTSANLMKNKPVSMNEVIKLHQDEGVLHLLHGLPSSRRIRQPAGAVSATVVRRRPSNENSQDSLMRQSQGKKSSSDYIAMKDTSSSQIPGLVRKSIAAGYGPKQQRPPPRQHSPKVNSLFSPLSNVKPYSKEELMTSESLELLKQLPSKTYMKLWSSSSRYILKNIDCCDSSKSNSSKSSESSQTNKMNHNNLESHTHSISSNSGNDASKFSNSGDNTVPLQTKLSSDYLKEVFNNDDEPRLAHKQMGNQKYFGDTSRSERKPELITKHFKDILIRSYSSFVQIIMSPVTTGLKHTINVNVCEELIDVMKQLLNIDDCKAILLTGIGTTFCQGIDLSLLTYDATEKQRKSAEAIATSVKKLIKFLINYPKVLVAAVNGVAQGLGVTLLPYFDITFASDKATFSLNTYAKLGQVPEGFVSHAFPSGNRRIFNEMLLLGKSITASEAKENGLVSSVIWPDKFFESIIPQMELLENIPADGLKVVHYYIKKQLQASVIDEETKQLIKNWTTPCKGKYSSVVTSPK